LLTVAEKGVHCGALYKMRQLMRVKPNFAAARFNTFTQKGSTSKRQFNKLGGELKETGEKTTGNACLLLSDSESEINYR